MTFSYFANDCNLLLVEAMQVVPLLRLALTADEVVEVTHPLEAVLQFAVLLLQVLHRRLQVVHSNYVR